MNIICKTWTGLSAGTLVNSADPDQTRNCPTIFCYMLLDFHVKTGTTFLLRDKWLIETSEVEIPRVDYHQMWPKCKRFF